MPDKCPLCGQSLPHAINQHELHARIQKLSSPLLAEERKRLKEESDSRVAAAIEKSERDSDRKHQSELREVGRRAQADAERAMGRQIRAAEVRASTAERRASAAEVAKQREVNQACKQTEARVRGEGERARAKDDVNHATEVARYKSIVDNLNRKLENKSGEQLGTEGEQELFVELRRAFPEDRFEQNRRGVKSADIVHSIMDGAKVVGKIVYERKNTSTWLNDFIVQAKKYRTEHETPHVMIVTRVFPPRYKGFCVYRDVPVVESRMVVALATVIRESIIQIAKLRLSGSAYDAKSIELYRYIGGDEFCTRFRDIAEGIVDLRTQQQKERTWHENAWQVESRIHDKIANRHREVSARIGAICSGDSRVGTSKIPSKTERWPSVSSVAVQSR